MKRGQNLKEDIQFYFELYDTSLKMNSMEQIKEDQEKKGFLVEYLEKLTSFALGYIKEIGLEALQKQENGRPYVLSRDRAWYVSAMNSITGTQAVIDTTWRFLAEERDLLGFFNYCDMIAVQVQNAYRNYFMDRCQSAGTMYYSEIADAFWDANKQAWVKGQRIVGKFIAIRN